MKRTTRNRIYHVMSVAFIIGSLLYSVFRFRPVFFRTLDALKDFALSIAYFVSKHIKPLKGKVTTTVTDIPSDTVALLPLTWAEFKIKAATFGDLIFDGNNFLGYFILVLNFLWKIFIAIIPAALIIGILCLVLWLKYRDTNKKHNVDSKALKRFYAFETKFCKPIKSFFLRYKNRFLRRFRCYKIALISIWLYNLNFFTIALEFIAYVVYLIKSNNYISIYTQIVKLFIDLSVSANFLPIIIQIYIGFKIFHKIRCRRGVKKLKKFIKAIEDLLSKIIGAIFLVGKQRSRKTTGITVLALVEAARYRKNAKKRMRKRARQFPHFPWRNVEATIRKARKKHTVYTLASCREFIRELRKLYENRAGYPKEYKRYKLKYLQRKYGYQSAGDFIFGYKYKKFRMTYNDGRVIVNVWDAVEHYARSYFIYQTPTPLIFSNYSIRTDEIKKSKGNLEKFDLDLVDRNPEEINRISQYSHIGDRDMTRLEKLMNPENPNKDALEFGVICYMEYEKEIGNQKTTEGTEKKANECNRKNDGHANWLKTVTHMATVDNETYFRPFFDGHRPDSLASDIRELCTLWRIKKTSDSKVILSFFAYEEALWRGLSKLIDWIEDKYSYIRGDNTLFIYLLRKLFFPFDNYCDKLVNKFSVYTNTLNMWDGSDEEVIKDKAKLTIPEATAFADRFATDGLGEYFHEKALRSQRGIDDVEQFKDKKMSVDEMIKVNSHIYSELGYNFKVSAFIKAREEMLRWYAEREKEKKEEAKQAAEKQKGAGA